MGASTGLAAATNIVNSARFQFQERSYYQSSVVPGIENYSTIDFWSGRPTRYFGKVDKQRDFIYLPWSYSDVNFLSVLADREGNRLKAINFVADAFSDLREDFTNKIAQGYGTPSLSDSILTSIEPKKAWNPIVAAYRDFMEEIYDDFFGDFLNENPSLDKQIFDFDSFITVFVYWLNNNKIKIPITRTGYMQSGLTSILNSGLAIEITEFEYGDDIFKQEFLQDPNFNLYASSANKHGFLIDVNAPWRLVANPNSVIMLEYMSKYNITFDDFFETYYMKSHEDDIITLRDYILEMYNTYVEASPTFVDEDKKAYGKVCGKYKFGPDNGLPDNVSIDFATYTRKSLDYEVFQERYSGYYWLDFYYIVRNIENNYFFPRENLQSRIKVAEGVFRKDGWDACMNYINQSFKNNIFSLKESTPSAGKFSDASVDFSDLVSISY